MTSRRDRVVKESSRVEVEMEEVEEEIEVVMDRELSLWRTGRLQPHEDG